MPGARTSSARSRAYQALRPSPRAHATREQSMHHAADLLWDALAPTGVSWIGFYLKSPVADEMTLGPRRDKPACSPIGLHGACGRCWRARRALVVRDVATLGEGYIACDPRDRSEVVVPLLDESGACWGVLDADSHDLDAFDADDAGELHRVMAALALTLGPPTRALIV